MRSSNVRVVQTVWALACAGTASFILIALAVGEGVTGELDRRMLLAFRDPADLSDALGPDWFEKMAAEVSALGGYTILVTVSAIAIVTLCLLRKFQAAFFLLAAIISGTVVSTALKYTFARPRPDLVDHLDRVFTSSFPSGHAMVSMVTWLTLAAVAVRFVPRHELRVFLLATALILSLLIGLSRVYLGVHWPSDVLAGWSLGAAWASGCWLAAHYLARTPAHSGDLGHSKA